MKLKIRSELIFCACGCKCQLYKYDSRGRERHHLPGHWARINKGWNRHPAWNRGLRGIHLNPETEFKPGIIPWNKGKKGVMPEAWNKGRTGVFSKETRIKMGLAKKGPNNRLWKGGTSTARNKAMDSLEYKQFRLRVFFRDDFKCQVCGEVGRSLQVHHIKPWSKYPKLRYEITNGITLCAPCHKKTDSYGKKD